jgi:hypothetical protein
MMIRIGTQQRGFRATPAVARPQPASQPVAPVLRRRCACGEKKPGAAGGPCECDRADDPIVARMPGHALPGTTIHDERRLQAVQGVLEREQGEPLARGVRDWAEGAFGHDLGGVRIHASRAAAQSSRAIDAAAYTVGQHIVFAAGAYEPGTSAGRKLLAHELAHTLQQGPVARFDSLSIGGADDPAEREAEAIAARTTPDGAVPRAPTAALASGTVARAPEGQEPQPGPAAEPSPSPEEDKCANFEKDRESMAWSIAREVYRSVGRSWPGIDKASCKDGTSGVSCELRMGDGLLVRADYNPANNTAEARLVDDRGDITTDVALCEMTYRCPETWQVEFSSACAPDGLRPNPYRPR